MTAPEIPEGRCVVCRQAWDPCRRCKGKAAAAKRLATMRAAGKEPHVPKPKAFQAFTMAKDPDLFPHRQETRRRRDAES